MTDTTVYTGFDVAAHWANWTVNVIVDGTNILDQLDDATQVTVEGERNAARLAKFAVALSGDLTGWIGKTCVIEYVTGTAATWRRFGGVIVAATVDLENRLLNVSATDDYQRIVDAMTDDAIKTAVSGKWSKYVFAEDAHGWRRLQDLLSTIDSSAELNTYGALELHGWQTLATANYTFDDGFIDDGSLSITLADRSNLVNRVDVTLSARFERLYQRTLNYQWSWPYTVCESFAWRINLFPTKQMVTDALTKESWRFISATYTELWASGNYSCSPDVIWMNFSGGNALMGFNAFAGLRWQQSITYPFKIAVTAPDSIAVYGELTRNVQYAADFKTTVEDWSNAPADTAYVTAPAGFARDVDGFYFDDQIDDAELANALDCAIAVAVQTINTSHRAGNIVKFSIPPVQHLALGHTVAISCGDVTIKGTVNKLSDAFDLSERGAPKTNVELLFSAGQSGLENVTQTWTVPTRPDDSDGGPYPSAVRTVPTALGADEASTITLPTEWGWFVNRTVTDYPPPDPMIIYDQRLEIKFDEIDDAKRLNRSQDVTATIAIDVPHHALVIT